MLCGERRKNVPTRGAENNQWGLSGADERRTLSSFPFLYQSRRAQRQKGRFDGGKTDERQLNVSNESARNMHDLDLSIISSLPREGVLQPRRALLHSLVPPVLLPIPLSFRLSVFSFLLLLLFFSFFNRGERQRDREVITQRAEYLVSRRR